MGITEEVRKESFKKSKDSFSAQESIVLMAIKHGHVDAWAISKYGNLLITSTRRALTVLHLSKKVIVPCGKVWNRRTGRYVTEYRIDATQLTLF